jgi:hypothetical protein
VKIRRRLTARKALIEKALADEYSGGPTILEELRWKVLVQQYGHSFVQMTDAKQKSFARTIREHLPGYAIQKTPITCDTPLGLVARAALYRLKSLDKLRRFIHGEDPSILCRYQTNMDVDEPRYWRSRYATPNYHVATFRFFAKRPAGPSYEDIKLIPGTLIPATQKLSLIVPPGMNVEMRAVAAVPWKLFGYEKLSDWHEVDATDRLGAVERNRR